MCLSDGRLAFGQTQLRTESWWGLMTSGQIASRWSLWMDAHYVPQLFLIGRSGLTYHTKDENFNFTVGYAGLYLTTPYSEGRLVRPERRPWGQVIFRLPSNEDYGVSFRFRYDVRFRANHDHEKITGGFGLNQRFRVNSSIRYNLGRSERLKAAMSASMVNETLVSTGPAAVDVPLEHRVFLLLGAQRRTATFSPGYHLRLQNTLEGQIRAIHGFVLWVNFNYRFRDFRRHLLEEYPADKL
ncbi:DUF2490 domain-containing protein [Negadavirga shengliensis]|uniref:DUF2490 domain-containing protein n=1 Tax=Negadavirga shengliensis TaxID=1389218 RepID=A0ABV9T978_9BACT